MKNIKRAMINLLLFAFLFSCQPELNQRDSTLQADKQMEAFQNKGRAYWDMQDAPRALAYFHKAIEASEGTKNYRALGEIYHQTGNLYAYQNIYDEALPMLRKGYNYLQLAADSAALPYIIQDIARIYTITEQKDSAMMYCQRGRKLARETGNKQLEAVMLCELGRLCLESGAFSPALKYLYASLNSGSDTITHIQHLNLGRLYAETHQTDSAYFYLNKSLNRADIQTLSVAYKYLSMVAEADSNFEQAVNYNHLHWLYRDSITQITNTEAAQKVESLYNYQLAEKESEELKATNKKKQIFIYQLSLFLIIAATASTVYMLREKNRRKELARKRQLQEKTKERQYKMSLAYIEENEQKIKELEKRLILAKEGKNEAQANLIQAQKEMLEITNQQVFSQQKEQAYLIDGFKQSDIYHKFHNPSNMDINKITDEEWTVLQVELNNVYDDFSKRLYALCPQLSIIELRICCLLKISVTVTNMARLLGRSKSAITAARIRLHSKLRGEAGTADKLDEFIISF